MNDRTKRLDEAQDVEQAARDHALRAFETARVAYHGALRSRRRDDMGRTEKLGKALDAAEDNAIRLGLDPWSPGARRRLVQLGD